MHFKFRAHNIVIAILVTLMVALTGCASKQQEELTRIGALSQTVSISKINNIRQTALHETAGGLGAQAGLAWRARQINDVLNSQQRYLERIYDFQAMLLDNNVLPPVLGEVRDTLTLDNSETIRLSDREYQIISPARFVTAAPTWHDYLWLSYKKPEPPDNSLLPRNGEERDLWNKYIKLGWNDGIRQANEIFAANLARLQRDYSGMILYRKLYDQKFVSAPFVSKADLGITGGGDKMRINDRVLRITAVSELDPNSKHWSPVIVEDKK